MLVSRQGWLEGIGCEEQFHIQLEYYGLGGPLKLLAILASLASLLPGKERVIVIKSMHFHIFTTVVLAGLLVAVPLLISGRKKKADTTVEVDGGVRHRVDTNAPKSIVSTEIVAFSCKFSALNFLARDTGLAGRIFTLHADQNSGSYEECTREKVYEKKTFTATPEFFAQLQQIVERYDFARYNGQFYTVSGLPPDFGANLEVRYASGERICASNNQSCFLPMEAMESLVALFKKCK